MNEETIHAAQHPAGPLFMGLPDDSPKTLAELFGHAVGEPTQEITAEARAVLLLRRKKEEIEKSLKEANSQLDQAEQHLYRRMTDIGLDNLKLDDNGAKVTVSRSTTVYYNAPAGSLDNDQFYQWLLQNGAVDLVKRSIHHASLSSLCGELVKAGKPLSPVINSVEKKSIRVLRK